MGAGPFGLASAYASSSSLSRSSSRRSRCACCPASSRDEERASDGRGRRAGRGSESASAARSACRARRCSPGLVGLVFFFPVFWMFLTQLQGGAGREREPEAASSPDARSLPRRDEQSPRARSSFATAATNSAGRRARQHAHRARACDPGRLRARDPSRAEMARRALLLHLDQVPARSSPRSCRSGSIASRRRQARTRARCSSCSTRRSICPLAIWMLRSFFMEIPRELIEAAEIDGAKLRSQLTLRDPADRRARHRGDRAPLRDLRLERVLLRGPAQPRRRLDDAAVGDDERQHARATSSRSSRRRRARRASPSSSPAGLAQKRMIRGLSMGAIK